MVGSRHHSQWWLSGWASQPRLGLELGLGLRLLHAVRLDVFRALRWAGADFVDVFYLHLSACLRAAGQAPTMTPTLLDGTVYMLIADMYCCGEFPAWSLLRPGRRCKGKTPPCIVPFGVGPCPDGTESGSARHRLTHAPGVGGQGARSLLLRIIPLPRVSCFL